uniref:hypothetical protein n=1 Tax=Thalassoglobus sp. TaxID=2795869 RepID=UPI003AA993E5
NPSTNPLLDTPQKKCRTILGEPCPTVLRPVSVSADKSPSLDINIPGIPVKKTTSSHEGMHMDIKHNILNELIDEAKLDEVGLWYVLYQVRSDFGVGEPELIKDMTLKYVREMLDPGEVCVGNYSTITNCFEEWNLSPDQVVSRIDRDWELLGRDPDIGEIVIIVGADRLRHSK